MSEYSTIRPVISSLGTFKGSEFRAKQVFEKLTLLGQTVRNRMALNQEMQNLPMDISKFLPVEPIVHSDCENFLKWAEKDGSGGKSIPAHLFQLMIDNLDINTYLIMESARRFKPGPPTRTSRRTSLPSRSSIHLPATIRTTEADYLACADAMEERLRKLASANYKTFTKQEGGIPEPKDYPTVYGLAICGPRIAIVALSAADPKEGAVRTLGVCDFSEAEQDLWNAVAVALVCLAARDEARERTRMDEYDEEVRRLMGKMAIRTVDEDQ